jgi:hypothetical protein
MTLRAFLAVALGFYGTLWLPTLAALAIRSLAGVLP